MDFNWLSDFQIQGRTVHVTKTGAIVRLDRTLFSEIGAWLTYYGPVRLKAMIENLLFPGPRILFTPDVPRPWYLVSNAVGWSGTRVTSDPRLAVAAFYFEDSTVGVAPRTPGLTCLNGACTDVSKSRVADIFEAVFGYPLAVDPRRWLGLAVEKGEKNGAHDGRVVRCPRDPAPGKVYQRLIDTIDDGMAQDLRTPCVDGEPVLVFIKRRPNETRFANHNTSVALAAPRDQFSDAELDAIRRFNKAMNLDWGGLDILRDRHDGRIYIVDVNKTDMPPLALPFRDKMRSTRQLAAALRRMVSRVSEAREP